MRMKVDHLEKVVAGPDTGAAAQACEAQVCMHSIMMKDLAAIEKHGWRFVELNRWRGAVWALLVPAAGSDGRPEEALAIARRWLKQDDSAEAHCNLGRALDRNGFWQAGEKEVRLALDRDPNHVPAKLALAACLLRNGTSADHFTRAAGLLDEVEKLSDGAVKLQNLDGWKHLQAVRLALQGERLRANLLFSELAASHKEDMTYQMGDAWTSGVKINGAALQAAVAVPQVPGV